MSMQRRVHRRLSIEELEPRVAPVTLDAINSTYQFIDQDGDTVDVTYSGSGSCEILDQSGGDPDGDDIATITFAGADSTTVLTVLLGATGGGGTTSISSVDATGQDLDWLRLEADVGGVAVRDIRKLSQAGAVGTVSVAGDVIAGGVLGAATFGSVSVGGSLNSRVVAQDSIGALSVQQNLAGSVVAYGDMGTVSIGGNASGHIAVYGQLTSSVSIGGDYSGEMWVVGGVVGDISIGGGLSGAISSDLGIGGSLAIGAVSGGALSAPWLRSRLAESWMSMGRCPAALTWKATWAA